MLICCQTKSISLCSSSIIVVWWHFYLNYFYCWQAHVTYPLPLSKSLVLIVIDAAAVISTFAIHWYTVFLMTTNLTYSSTNKLFLIYASNALISGWISLSIKSKDTGHERTDFATWLLQCENGTITIITQLSMPDNIEVPSISCVEGSIANCIFSDTTQEKRNDHNIILSYKNTDIPWMKMF